MPPRDCLLGYLLLFGTVITTCVVTRLNFPLHFVTVNPTRTSTGTPVKVLSDMSRATVVATVKGLAHLLCSI
ncbi:hypothetical protein [Microcoleus sp. FACHB-68]|uniref:hypothetical protein n=1 Tax=Microcoleus sp. FACHB-68 TaxID=2692826 RepID=UPI0016831E20|nr:hypothetical protein [Microcoleus sp. FACHB-68]MBD1936160.1 hypothetical protein [Microcoleus sp. FACHB-68]